jgi:hypothetical protein
MTQTEKLPKPTFTPKTSGLLQRAGLKGSRIHEVPPIVHEVLHSPGQLLDSATRAFMEPRFGRDFSGVRTHNKHQSDVSAKLSTGAPDDSFEREAEITARRVMSRTDTPVSLGYDFRDVRVHADARAAASAQAIGALAYTVGNDIAFDTGRYAPNTREGKSLLAHELAHVVQQGNLVRPYRRGTAFNFGVGDDASWIEDSFNIKRDRQTKPWIKLIAVEFTARDVDSDGNHYWKGSGLAQYYDNPAKLPDLSFEVSGGSRELGRTDRGNFTVQRIEGIGYNSGTLSGEPGVDYDPAEREGPRKRYSKDLASNMSFAVFYNRGEALHEGPLDYSSHGCVHVDWNKSEMRQINYHSVIGLTKVKVRYS